MSAALCHAVARQISVADFLRLLQFLRHRMLGELRIFATRGESVSAVIDGLQRLRRQRP